MNIITEANVVLPSLEERLVQLDEVIRELREEYLSTEPVAGNVKVRTNLKLKIEGMLENRTVLLNKIHENQPAAFTSSPLSTSLSQLSYAAMVSVPKNLPLFEGETDLSIKNAK